jgi:hypothetical protein
LIGFGAMQIVNRGEDKSLLICHNGLLENGGCKMSLGRWKALVILKEKEERETVKLCVFTLGMMIYAIVMRKEPFHNDNDEIGVRKMF